MCGSFGGSKHMWDGLSETMEHAETHKRGALDPVHPQAAEARPQVCRCPSPPTCWQTQAHCTSSPPGRTLHSQRERLKWTGWACPSKFSQNSILTAFWESVTKNGLIQPPPGVSKITQMKGLKIETTRKGKEKKENLSQAQKHSKLHLKQGMS